MTKEITLDRTQFIHLAARSTYNNNYYQHKETGEIILEQYEECSNAYEYFRYGQDQLLTFLGTSVNHLDEGIITIDPDWI
jgi:hypothetical protein